MTTNSAQQLADALVALIAEVSRPLPVPRGAITWRERVWTCPPDTRLGVVELAEALGRSKSFIYRCTRTKTIPFRKLDGELTFRAGDIRTWLQRREEVVVTAHLREVA